MRTAFSLSLCFICLALAPHAALAQTATGFDAPGRGGNPTAARAALHFLAGMASGLLAAGAVESTVPARTIGEYPLFLPALALSSATASGIAKELLDSTGFGAPRFTEILFTMAGGLAAAGMIGGLQSARIEDPVPLLSIGALLAIPVVIGLLEEIVGNAQRPRSGPMPNRPG